MRSNLKTKRAKTPTPIADLRFDVEAGDDPDVFLNPTIDLYIRLEELHPSDANERSGLEMNLCGGGGEHTVLTVGFGSHILGYMNGEALRTFVCDALSASTVSATLGEFYPEMFPWSGSGVELMHSGANEELTVVAGPHCFGVVRGKALSRFLDAAHARIGVSEPKLTTKNIINFAEAARKVSALREAQ